MNAARFHDGDFIWVRRGQKNEHKLHLTWWAPRLFVTAKSKCVYEDADILKGNSENFHLARLMLYRAPMDDTDLNPSLLSYTEFGEHIKGRTIVKADLLDNTSNQNTCRMARISWPQEFSLGTTATNIWEYTYHSEGIHIIKRDHLFEKEGTRNVPNYIIMASIATLDHGVP